MATGTLVEASVHARTTITASVPLGAATPIDLIRIRVERLDVSLPCVRSAAGTHECFDFNCAPLHPTTRLTALTHHSQP